MIKFFACYIIHLSLILLFFSVILFVYFLCIDKLKIFNSVLLRMHVEITKENEEINQDLSLRFLSFFKKDCSISLETEKCCRHSNYFDE